MRSTTSSIFRDHNHPLGQVVVSGRRTVHARANALAGYRLDRLQGPTVITAVRAASASDCVTAN